MFPHIREAQFNLTSLKVVGFKVIMTVPAVRITYLQFLLKFLNRLSNKLIYYNHYKRFKLS